VTPAPLKSIEQVQAAHEATWLALPKVIGTGIAECEGRPCLNVFVSAPDAAHAQIPSEVEGYPVRIVTVGDVKALNQ
jgi:hypothetical protein